MSKHLPLVVVFLGSLVSAPLFAQSSNSPAGTSSKTWVSQVETMYRFIVPNVTYLTAGGTDVQLDLYLPKDTSTPNPTVIFIHGGGWVGGDRQSRGLSVLPYLEMGFTVVNIDYRLAKHALAPAAVEDCRCALRWVVKNAKQYGFDTNRIVVTGQSAGGHLALMTGMLPTTSEFDRQCAGPEQPKVAAIINWYGITDVPDLLDGPNRQGFAVQWLSSLPNRADLARALSPVTYVRAGIPPILTIHGDADKTVPYGQATQLRQALNSAGAANEMVTVAAGGHGNANWKPIDMIGIYDTLRAFLTKHKLVPGIAGTAVPSS
jgi:acetyl esterase/lipase